MNRIAVPEHDPGPKKVTRPEGGGGYGMVWYDIVGTSTGTANFK